MTVSLNAHRLLVGVFLLSLATGCATMAPQAQSVLAQRPGGMPARAELADTPFFPEEDNQCGPATLAMALQAAGAKVSLESLREQVYLPERKGSLQVEMLAAARRHGMIALELAPNLTDALREVAAGTPVVVLQNLGLDVYPLWHYALLVGYDLDRAELILRSGGKRRMVVPLALFEGTWRKSGYWAMVVAPPGRLPVTATEPAYVAAAAALERLGQLRPARTAYSTLLSHWPDSAPGWFGLGNVSYGLGDLPKAEAAFRRVSELRPESAEAFNNLAQTLADLGRLDEAHQAARRAVALGGPFLTNASATLDSIVQLQARQTAPNGEK